MDSSTTSAKISQPAFKYLDDTWSNFVSWQANIKIGGGLFTQSRIDVEFIADDKSGNAQKIAERNVDALEVYVKGKNNFGEMMFCRIMDDFEYYLFDISFRVLRNNPRILKNKDTDKYNNEMSITLNDILDNLDSTEAILHMTLNHKLDSIKRNQGGYEGLVRFIEKKITGSKDLLKKEEYLKLKKYYSLRCLFTHSGGIIDSQFVKNFPEYKSQLGERYKLEEENVMNVRSVMNLIIVAIDARVIRLLSEDDLVKGNYMHSLTKGQSLIEFSEIMGEKIKRLIEKDNSQSKLKPNS